MFVVELGVRIVSDLESVLEMSLCLRLGLGLGLDL